MTYIVNTKRERSRTRTPPRQIETEPQLVQGMTKTEYIDYHINELLEYAAQLKEQSQ